VTTYQQRRGTTSQWATPTQGVPKDGELVINEETGAVKIGDGTTVYADLPAVNSHYDCRRNGVKGDGTTNDRAALAAADTAALAAGLPLLLPKGIYKVNTDLTIASRVIAQPGAIIKPASGIKAYLQAGLTADPLQQIADHSLGGQVIPQGVPFYHPGWWGLSVDRSDDSLAWTWLSQSLSTLAALTTYSNVEFGARVMVPPGRNRFMGITLAYCQVIAHRGASLIMPPTSALSGTVLTLDDYASIDGGFFATDGGHTTGVDTIDFTADDVPNGTQAVTLCHQRGYRSVVNSCYFSNRDPNSTGLVSGDNRWKYVPPTSSTYTLTVNGNTTASIAFNASLATIKSRIETADPTAIVTVSLETIAGIVNTVITPTRGYITLSGTGLLTAANFYSASTSPVVTNLMCIGVVTIGSVPAGSIGWQICSPDLEASNCMSAGYDKGMLFSRGGAARLNNVHVWSNNYGIAGDALDATQWTNVYLDTNEFWGIDVSSMDRAVFTNIYANGNGQSYIRGGATPGGALRLQGNGQFSTFKNVVLSDNADTGIYCNGPDYYNFDIILHSSNKQTYGHLLKQTSGGLADSGSDVVLKGIELTASSLYTEYRVRGADAVTPVVDAGFASTRVTQPPRRVLRTSNFTRPNNTLSASGLGFDMEVSRKYLIRGLIVCSNPAAGPDMKFALELTSGTVTSGYFTTPSPIAVTEINASGDLVSAANHQAIVASGGAGIPVGLVAGVTQAVQFQGFIDVGATAGTLRLLVAQNSTDAGNLTTFYAGSWIEIEEIA
jgi:hypothetical protein